MNSSRRSLRDQGVDILFGILRKQNIGVDDFILEYLAKMNNLKLNPDVVDVFPRIELSCLDQKYIVVVKEPVSFEYAAGTLRKAGIEDKIAGIDKFSNNIIQVTLGTPADRYMYVEFIPERFYNSSFSLD